jgi:hypothetical protein
MLRGAPEMKFLRDGKKVAYVPQFNGWASICAGLAGR